ncbi:MAG: thiamine pyrophosphate-binding protein [Trueperaceae bacterium]
METEPQPAIDPDAQWTKVLEPDELPEGRVKAVDCGLRRLCLTRFEGRYGALDHRCPHQGGPLADGSIEKGWLRCPWHGWDFHPTTGRPPEGFDDAVPAYPVEERADGVYVALPPEPEVPRTVADAMVETMVAWGTRWVFGMVGHSNLHVAEAVRRAGERGDLGYVAIRHEGAAAFAASAYGKLTGRPAACLAIAGPGATNLLTGLWDAHVDRSPVLALTGQVATQVLGTGDFQEVDLRAAYGGVAVWSATVLPGSHHEELMGRAWKSAVVERGVAHLVFPDEVAGQASDAPAGDPAGRVAEAGIRPDPHVLDEAERLVAAAERPVVVVGHGARFDMDAVVALAEALHAPVLTTFKAKGQIPDDHPLAAGVLGRSGTPVASWFMNEADLLIVFGASFSTHTGISPMKPTIQVDRDRAALAKFHAIDLPVWGDVAPVALELRDRAAGRVADDAQRGELAERWALWRSEKARRREDDRGRGLAGAAVFAALERHVPADAVMTVDVGNNTYAFGRTFETRGQTVLLSGYLGSIGFALPAALGAWAATQEPGPWHGRKVVSVSGDGGLGQYLAELTTLVRHGMDVTHVLLVDGQLGKISKEQRDGGLPVWQTDLVNPDFAAFARSCGAHAVRVERREDLDGAFATALAHPGPALVEVHVDPALV